MDALLGGDAAVLLPATPFAAPKLGMPVEQLDDCWMPIITLVAPAAMSGLPQARRGDLPRGLKSPMWVLARFRVG